MRLVHKPNQAKQPLKKMKIFWKILIGIILCGLVFILGLIYIISPFSAEDMCGNKISITEFSPNKKHKIVIFCRNCGATTDFSTQVSILKVDEKLENESGNIFSADSEHGKAKTDENSSISIKAKWLNNNKVIITYDKNARTFKTENSLDEIEIEYIKNY